VYAAFPPAASKAQVKSRARRGLKGPIYNPERNPEKPQEVNERDCLAPNTRIAGPEYQLLRKKTGSSRGFFTQNEERQ